jgi:hypothetical protein
MPRHPLGPAVATVLALSLGATGCGATKPASKAAPSGLQACRDQWHDVAGTVVGLDEDTDPSGLASRWTSVIATIQYYENTTTAKDCRATVEAQLKSIDALRRFSERVRRYDMAYQLTQLTASADLYAHAPLPAPVRNATGKLVAPPTKAAVAAAMLTLSSEAATANGDLQPGWEQLASVELTDSAAVTSALQDLDFLAQDSVAWRHCEQAVQVLVTAVHAQEGSTGESEPTGSPTPSSSPTG